MSKKELEKFANKATSDSEQKKWENKKLGVDKNKVSKSNFKKSPSKLISIRVPDDVLDALRILAEEEGLRYQTYVVSILKKHIKKAS